MDPYYLYAASNAGSLIALISYPSAVEPVLALSTQTNVWSVGYGVATALTAVCAIVLWRSSRGRSVDRAQETGERITTWRRARWIALAFVPSSLMLAVTAYLSTDVAPVPLLWIVPLALYLITFILAFSHYAERVRAVCWRAFPIVLLLLVWLLVSEIRLPLMAMAVVHLLAFFVLAMCCHATLAEDRPSTAHLTVFYLSLAVGGVLGGLFNTILAPLLFNGVAEYPIVVAAAAFLLTFRPEARELLRSPRFWLEPTLAAVLAGLALTLPVTSLMLVVIVFGLTISTVVVCLSVWRMPGRFGAAVALVMAVYLVAGGRTWNHVADASRTFFGIYRVVSDPSQPLVSFVHGTTLHGQQRRGDPRPEPMAYFHRESPVAEALAATSAATAKSIGVVGLGIGTLAAYRQPGQHWTFYEIDPEVERIARDSRFFTHLKGCGSACTVVIGDARLSLDRRSGVHDALILDAFSSDVVPIHLLTREAIAVYLSRLAPNGVLAFHISNRHVDLRPVIAGLAREQGLVGRTRLDQAGAKSASGRNRSLWAVVARTPAALGALAHDERWEPLMLSDRVWTDDFSNIWSVIEWQR